MDANNIQHDKLSIPLQKDFILFAMFNPKKDVSNKEGFTILAVAAIATAIVYTFFIGNLPPSPCFYDGLGRIALVCVINGIILWIGFAIFRPKIPLTIGEMLQGIMLSGFAGTILGVIIAEILDKVGISF